MPEDLIFIPVMFAKKCAFSGQELNYKITHYNTDKATISI
jgi:hypothetical protein